MKLLTKRNGIDLFVPEAESDEWGGRDVYLVSVQQTIPDLTLMEPEEIDAPLVFETQEYENPEDRDFVLNRLMGQLNPDWFEIVAVDRTYICDGRGEDVMILQTYPEGRATDDAPATGMPRPTYTGSPDRMGFVLTVATDGPLDTPEDAAYQIKRAVEKAGFNGVRCMAAERK